MNILAIDSTGVVASAAIVDEEKTICEISTNCGKTHSQTLLPMIQQMTELAQFDIKAVDYIGCASGPGSFTGLRIGAATAKGLARGLNKSVVPVPTLDALAYNVFEPDGIVAPIMDARRGQVYGCLYQWRNGKPEKLKPHMAEDLQDIMTMALSYGVKVIFLGDGASVYKDTIQNYSDKFTIAASNVNMQRGASVGTAALEIVKNGGAIAARDFVPFYLRKPQAERELEEKRRYDSN